MIHFYIGVTYCVYTTAAFWGCHPPFWGKRKNPPFWWGENMQMPCQKIEPVKVSPKIFEWFFFLRLPIIYGRLLETIGNPRVEKWFPQNGLATIGRWFGQPKMASTISTFTAFWHMRVWRWIRFSPSTWKPLRKWGDKKSSFFFVDLPILDDIIET